MTSPMLLWVRRSPHVHDEFGVIVVCNMGRRFLAGFLRQEHEIGVLAVPASAENRA